MYDAGAYEMWTGKNVAKISYIRKKKILVKYIAKKHTTQTMFIHNDNIIWFGLHKNEHKFSKGVTSRQPDRRLLSMLITDKQQHAKNMARQIGGSFY